MCVLLTGGADAVDSQVKLLEVKICGKIISKEKIKENLCSWYEGLDIVVRAVDWM